jgi:uncharacterized protein YhhL (DUF1145 family)
MVELALNILWLLIGVIILLGVVWLALYVIKLFCPVPDRIEQAIWAVVLILCLIGAISLLAGGGRLTFHGPNFSSWWESVGA